MLVPDGGRAVSGDSIIPPRVISHLVERSQVFVEALAGLCGGSGEAVKIDFFVAVVRADADDIALVGDDVDERELPIEAADGGKVWPTFFRVSMEKQIAGASANWKLTMGCAIHGEPQ